MSYYNEEQEPDYEKEWLRKCFGEDWIEGREFFILYQPIIELC